MHDLSFLFLARNHAPLEHCIDIKILANPFFEMAQPGFAARNPGFDVPNNIPAVVTRIHSIMNPASQRAQPQP